MDEMLKKLNEEIETCLKTIEEAKETLREAEEALGEPEIPENLEDPVDSADWIMIF